MLAPSLEQIFRDQVCRGERCRMLPRHGVDVYAPDGGGERFARLFVETWRRIPLAARRRILAYWKAYDGRFSWMVPRSPEIQLVEGWEGRKTRTQNAMAEASALGHRMRFWLPRVQAMPDELARDLIAHELTHVYQWASGWDIHEDDNVFVEEDADRTMGIWGFDADAMDAWTLEQGLTKIIDASGWSDARKKRHNAAILKNGRGSIVL